MQPHVKRMIDIYAFVNGNLDAKLKYSHDPNLFLERP
jgi:hypothetical protein